MWLPTFVGPTNFSSHYLLLLGQQIILPIFFYTVSFPCPMISSLRLPSATTKKPMWPSPASHPSQTDLPGNAPHRIWLPPRAASLTTALLSASMSTLPSAGVPVPSGDLLRPLVTSPRWPSLTQAHDEDEGASSARAHLLTGVENKREKMTAWPHMSFTPQMNLGSMF